MKNLFPSLPENATLGSLYQKFPDNLAPLSEYMNRVMRGPSELSVAQREIVAAFVSGLNACAFCHGAHKIHAKAHGVEVQTIEALMADVQTAPIEPKLRSVLSYVEKLTRSPARMTEADAAAVYASGWSESALFDAIQVCGVFNLINRFLEGTGITEYHMDPNNVEDGILTNLRSETCYSDFGRANGLSD